MIKNSHVLVCCDFDGTVAVQDTGVLLIDYCMGAETRKQLDEKAMKGELPLRYIFEKMWGSVDLTWDEALEILKDVELEHKFPELSSYCFSQEIPLYIVTAGLKFMIEHFFQKFFPTSYHKFNIEANYGEIKDGKWEVTFRDDSDFGHDKGLTMDEAEADYISKNNGAKPYIIFCGDGVSDLSAARRADLLFVRRGKGLEKYCIEHKIQYAPFDDFQVVLDAAQKAKLGQFQ